MSVITKPNEQVVNRAYMKFLKENEDDTEKPMRELFKNYPLNNDLTVVILKVAILNSLYRTNLQSYKVIIKVAKHICKLNIDSRLNLFDKSLVDEIKKVKINRRNWEFYSFATKYCHWHHPDKFPMFDSNVERYLKYIKRRKTFTSEYFKRVADLKNYKNFVGIINDFQKVFCLQEKNYKEIDTFLFDKGRKLKKSKK